MLHPQCLEEFLANECPMNASCINESMRTASPQCSGNISTTISQVLLIPNVYFQPQGSPLTSWPHCHQPADISFWFSPPYFKLRFPNKTTFPTKFEHLYPWPPLKLLRVKILFPISIVSHTHFFSILVTPIQTISTDLIPDHSTLISPCTNQVKWAKRHPQNIATLILGMHVHEFRRKIHFSNILLLFCHMLKSICLI